MSDALETFIFPEGRLIIEEGAPAVEAYMIERGKVRVYINKDNEQIDLAELGEDEIFGETALFTGSEYGANVEAIEETTVVKITPEILDIKIRLCDPMLRALIRMMMKRQRDTNKRLADLKG